MADKAPTREEMDKLYESFKDETPPGVMLPMGKEGTKKIMKKLKKIRGMKDGGDVAKPKSKPKNFKKTVQKQKRDRAIASGQLNIGDFNEMTPSMMQDFYKNASKVKKMKLGGEAKPLVGGQKKLDKNKDGRISGDDFAMMKDGGVAKRTKKEKIYGELPKGSKGRGMQNTFNNVKQLEAMARGDTLELGSLEKMPEGRRRVLQTIKKIQRDPSGTKNVYRGQGDVITSSQEEERAEKAKTKPKKMKMGGKVEEYGGGGSVKGGKMSCRGMGAAIKGGGFSIR